MIWTAWRHFKPTQLKTPAHCQACRKLWPANSIVPLRTYKAAINRNHTFRTVLCDEKCWQIWEERYWEARGRARRLQEEKENE